MQASTSMLEAKGEEILSWCDDDNFILEDDLAPDFEVPFLYMDLHALANQLSKLKLSQRLFIEEDLLPEDLADASEDNEVLIECDASLETDAKSSPVHYNIKNIQPRKDESCHDHAGSTCSDNQTEIEDELQCPERKASMSPKISAPLVQPGDEDKSYSFREGLKYEVASAEEELDVLLNSFSGTHLFGSNLDEPFGHNSAMQGMKIGESNEKETSLSFQNKGFTASNMTYQPTLKPGDNSEFKHISKIDVTTSVDDSVDDLLEDSSLCLNEPKQTASAVGQNNTSGGSDPPSGHSNVADDFDSWFDSL
ncbi:hypothetical protein QOZ80_5BG0411280 [Eleusine coracana subsp. coracana]|nr:hypothetical protein QOZ80_5BG0411280 [Eleusine coracana subsp. coracana]